MAENLGAAIVAGGAAVAGALVGGVATYFSNQNLYETQREDLSQGTARVLQEDLYRSAEDWRLYWKGYLEKLPGDFDLHIPAKDLVRVANEMDEQSWLNAAFAVTSIRYLRSELDSKRRLPCRLQTDSGAWNEAMLNGVNGLNEVAKTESRAAVSKKNIETVDGFRTNCVGSANGRSTATLDALQAPSKPNASK